MQLVLGIELVKRYLFSSDGAQLISVLCDVETAGAEVQRYPVQEEMGVEIIQMKSLAVFVVSAFYIVCLVHLT